MRKKPNAPCFGCGKRTSACHKYAKETAAQKIDGAAELTSWVEKASESKDPTSMILYKNISSSADNYAEAISTAAKAGMPDDVILQAIGTDSGVGERYTNYKKVNGRASLETFADVYYYSYSDESAGDDFNGDGKADKGHEHKDKMFAYINKLDLSEAQKQIIWEQFYKSAPPKKWS